MPCNFQNPRPRQIFIAPGLRLPDASILETPAEFCAGASDTCSKQRAISVPTIVTQSFEKRPVCLEPYRALIVFCMPSTTIKYAKNEFPAEQMQLAPDLI